jgi:hypothetical protein
LISIAAKPVDERDKRINRLEMDISRLTSGGYVDRQKDVARMPMPYALKYTVSPSFGRSTRGPDDTTAGDNESFSNISMEGSETSANAIETREISQTQNGRYVGTSNTMYIQELVQLQSMFDIRMPEHIGIL